MLAILADHDIEGQGRLLWDILAAEGWPGLLELRLVIFAEAGLTITASDRAVWRYAQQNAMLLLTANRTMNDPDSLEQTLRDENSASSLPVIIVGDANKVYARAYRDSCATRLVEIIMDLDNYRGVGRVFIP
jgi:hypothetical protein